MAAARQDRGKRHLLESAWTAKLFARLTELSWSDVCASSRHFRSCKKKKRKKIIKYRDTAIYKAVESM